MTSPKHQVEALLFSSGKAMNIDKIVELSRLDRAKATRALKALKKEYGSRDSAITIEQDGNDWKMTVTNEYLPLVRNIVADTELSRPCMETLAVIAYRHPAALQSEVISTRGGGAYEHITELERLGFLRKERSGRTFSLKLTEKFFDYFEVGEKGIKAVFKGVKPPERQERLGDMEVVDVPEEQTRTEPAREQGEEPVVTEKNGLAFDESHQKFLDDLDERIASIASKNDEHEGDPALQRAEPEEEEAEQKESKDN